MTRPMGPPGTARDREGQLMFHHRLVYDLSWVDNKITSGPVPAGDTFHHFTGISLDIRCCSLEVMG